MIKVKRKFFVAYGSLKNVDKMIIVCPESYIFGWGKIPKFELADRMFVSVGESTASYVPFVLWSITEEDEIELDDFIDLDVYRKDMIRVILTDVNDLVAPYNAEYYREGVKALVYLKKEHSC